MNLKNIRNDYNFTALSEADCPPKPMELFEAWLKQWLSVKPEYEAGTEFVLATDEPSARVLLLKGFDEMGLKFFTNYASQKGKALELNNRAMMLFFWSKIARQVRISTTTTKLSREENEEYFLSRPRDSQISASLATQSEKISISSLELRRNELQNREIECPENWGGYLAVPYKYEFWQGRPNRMHDRICYELVDGSWQIYRVAP